MINMRIIGANCKSFRVSKGYKQLNVAYDTGYSLENVSAFECGRNDNYRVLLWYIIHGMDTSDLIRGCEY